MRRTVRPFLALTLVLGLLAAFEGSASAALASVTPAPMCQSDGSVSSDPAVTAKNRRVQDVLISASTDTVYFGGRFTSLLPPTGGSPSVRNRLGACKLSSGEILPWNPNADGHVYALATDGTTVYAGGSFKNVGGVYHPGLVAINPSSGAVLTWKPKLGGGVVKSLAISGTTLYLGGTFKTVNGEARRALAAVDTKDGSLKDWNPASGFDPAATYDVRALAVSGTKILAGEYYTSNTMPNLMAIDATTASALPWKYAPTRPILDLSVSGSRLYAAAAGSGGRLYSFDVTSGSFKWSLSTDGNIQGVWASGDAVYAGGHFDNIKNSDGTLTPRDRLLAVGTDKTVPTRESISPARECTPCRVRRAPF